jgi:hypothetical protein
LLRTGRRHFVRPVHSRRAYVCLLEHDCDIQLCQRIANVDVDVDKHNRINNDDRTNDHIDDNDSAHNDVDIDNDNHTDNVDNANFNVDERDDSGADNDNDANFNVDERDDSGADNDNDANTELDYNSDIDSDVDVDSYAYNDGDPQTGLLPV